MRRPVDCVQANFHHKFHLGILTKDFYEVNYSWFYKQKGRAVKRFALFVASSFIFHFL